MSIRRSMTSVGMEYIKLLRTSLKRKVSYIYNGSQSISESETETNDELKSLNEIGVLRTATMVLTPYTYSPSRVHTFNNINNYNLSVYTEDFDNVSWNKTVGFTTINPDVTISPIGTNNADGFNSDQTSNPHYMQSSATVISGNKYVISVYAKRDVSDIIQIAGTTTILPNAFANFDLLNGVVGTFVGENPTIENVGNGWYRCSVTFTVNTSIVGTSILFALVTTPTSPRLESSSVPLSVFVWGSQVILGDVNKPYKRVFDTREFVVTRGAVGYRTNNDGLIEQVPYNLVSRSEEFDNSAWAKTRSSVVPNAILDPNGNMTADLTISDETNNSHYNGVATSTISGQKYTVSMYFKAGISSLVQILGGSTVFGINNWANFDIVNGLLGSKGTTTTNHNIENVGNGWYRCSCTFLATASVAGTGFFYCFIPTITSGRLPSITGPANLYVWGAQMVFGESVMSYLPTIDRLSIPRIDYSNGFPTILIEPAKIQVLQRTEEFDNVTWVRTNVSVTNVLDTTPNSNIPVQVQEISATESGGTIKQLAGSSTSSSARVFSVWLRRISGVGNIILELGSNTKTLTISNNWTRYDLVGSSLSSTYTITSNVVTVTLNNHGFLVGETIRYNNVTGLVVSNNFIITSVPSLNEFTFSFTAANSSGTGTAVANTPRIKINVSGDTIHVWGAMLELIQGNTTVPMPTSYIQNINTSTITRSTDVFKIGGLQGNGFIGSNFTMYIYFKRNGGGASSTTPLLGLTVDITNTDFIHVNNSSTGNLVFYKKENNGTAVSSTPLYITPQDDFVKVFLVCNNNRLMGYIDGSPLWDTTFANPQLLNSTYTTTSGTMWIRNLSFWNTALSYSEIEKFTTRPFFDTGLVLDSDLQKVVNRAVSEGWTIPNNTILTSMNVYITTLKTLGVWDSLDLILQFEYNDITLDNFSRINWKLPYGITGAATIFGNMTYDVRGWKGDGVVGSYIDTRHNPLNFGGNYTLNMACRFTVITQYVSGTMTIDGTTSTTTNNMSSGNATSNVKINQSTSSTVGSINIVAGTGLKGVVRQNNNVIGYTSKTSSTTGTVAPSSIANLNQLILRTSTTYGTSRVGGYIMGGGLTPQQVSDYADAYNTFSTSIGLSQIIT